MKQKRFTTTSQKAHKLAANETGMNMATIFKLEKQRGSQNKKKLVLDDKEITDQTQTHQNAGIKTQIEMEIFFSYVDIPKLSEN